MVAIIIGTFLPESPRYLVHKKKFRKAFQVLKKINQINGNELQDDNTVQNLLQRSQADFKMINTSIIQKFNLITAENKQAMSAEVVTAIENQSAFQFLLKSKKNFAQTVLLILAWFLTTLSYAGIQLKPFCFVFLKGFHLINAIFIYS